MGRSDNSVYLPTTDGRLTGISLDTGRVRWEFTAGTEIVTRPRVIGSSVFANPSRAGMYSLDTESGLELWRQPVATEFTAASDTRIYAYDSVGRLLVLEAGTGRVTGSLSMRQFPVHLANEMTDRIVVATRTGLVAMFHEQGRTQPIFHRNPDRRP